MSNPTSRNASDAQAHIPRSIVPFGVVRRTTSRVAVALTLAACGEDASSTTPTASSGTPGQGSSTSSTSSHGSGSSAGGHGGDASGASSGAGGETSGSGGSGASAGRGGEAIDPPTAWATDGIHVSVDGNDDDGDGTEAAPYRHIQYVLDVIAGEGDTVLVHAGTYDEEVRIRHSDLLLQGVEGEMPHVTIPPAVDGSDYRMTVEIDAVTSGVSLRGLEISGGFYAVYLGSAWDDDDTPLDNDTATDVSIDDCRIHDSGFDAIKLPAGTDRVTVRRCEIHHSGRAYAIGTSPDEMNAECVDVVNADHFRLADSHLHDCATSCVYAKGGSIGTIIERVWAERCGDAGVALGFDTSPEYFDTSVNPDYYESLGGVVRNCVIQDTGLAGVLLYSSLDARVLHNTLVRTGTRAHAALFLGVATQDFSEHGGQPPNVNPTIVGNVVDQTGVSDARCFGIRHGEEPFGVINGLDGSMELRDNLYFAGGASCAFEDQRPETHLETGDLAAWQSHAPGFDDGSTFEDPLLDEDGRLRTGSPATDATDATDGVTYDFQGDQRQFPYDIGADEAQ